MDFVDLEGEEVKLFPAGYWGLEDMFEYSRDPRFYRFMEGKPHASIDETRKYLDRWLAEMDSGRGHLWFICRKGESQVLGSVGLWDVDEIRKSVGFGYGMAPGFQGRGYMQDALRAVFKHLFGDLGFHRVHGLVGVRNVPSIRVVERFGFVKEGVLREYYHHEDGSREDAVVVAMLRWEYVARLQGGKGGR